MTAHEYVRCVLVALGLSVNNSADLRLANWLVKQVGEEAVRSVTKEFTSRHKPRPLRVVRLLGLENKLPDPEWVVTTPPLHSLMTHALHRRQGLRVWPEPWSERTLIT